MTLEELKASPKLRAHETVVLHSIASLVDNLDDVECLFVLIRKITRHLYPHSIHLEHYEVGKLLVIVVVVFNKFYFLNDETRPSEQGGHIWGASPQLFHKFCQFFQKLFT